jgi:hypothetical protein
MALKTTYFLPFHPSSISSLDREVPLVFLNFNSTSFILNYLKIKTNYFVQNKASTESHVLCVATRTSYQGN